MRLTTTACLALSAVWMVQAAAQTPPAREFREEAARQAEIYKSVGAQTPEGYIVGRSLLSYVHTLPNDFRESLAKLGPNERWLDIGAGEGRAVVDYAIGKYDVLLRTREGAPGKARAVALSIEDRRTPYWHQNAAELGEGRITYLAGKRLREYSAEELGRFEVITDVLGAFSYTRQLSTFMGKALGLLNVGGSFYTVLQDVRSEQGTNRPFYPNASYLTEIRKADGAEMKVCEWLKRITCVEVTCALTADSSPPSEVYRMKKTCEQVTVPPLVLTHFEAGTPPERRFLVKEEGR